MMPCISLHQPYASLCVLPSLADASIPVKPYETRGRPFPHKYIGKRLLIHAAKKFTDQQRDLCFEKPFRFVLERFGMLRYEGLNRQILTMDLGCIVGAVDVVGCYAVAAGGKCMMAQKPIPVRTIPVPTGDALAFGDFSIGRFVWALRNPVMFKTPIPYKGRQGFFRVPDDVVKEQLKLSCRHDVQTFACAEAGQYDVCRKCGAVDP